MWRSAICDAINRDLKALIIQANCKGRSTLSIIPYMRLLKVEMYADILLDEIRTLAEGSETFSQSVAILYSNIGRKVQERYNVTFPGMGQCSNFEKIPQILHGS